MKDLYYKNRVIARRSYEIINRQIGRIGGTLNARALKKFHT